MTSHWNAYDRYNCASDTASYYEVRTIYVRHEKTAPVSSQCLVYRYKERLVRDIALMNEAHLDVTPLSICGLEFDVDT